MAPAAAARAVAARDARVGRPAGLPRRCRLDGCAAGRLRHGPGQLLRLLSWPLLLHALRLVVVAEERHRPGGQLGRGQLLPCPDRLVCRGQAGGGQQGSGKALRCLHLNPPVQKALA